MVAVYEWPPVAVIASEWTEEAPISVSRSLISGRRYVSSWARKRQLATVVVSSLGRGRMGAGHCEVLKTLLDGGANLVRLPSRPVNWARDALRDAGHRQSRPLNWTNGGVDLDWTHDGTELLWYRGTVLHGTVTTDDGWPAVLVTGLPAGRLVARPGEYLTVYNGTGNDDPDTVVVQAAAWSNQSGAARIRTLTAAAHDGRVNIGVSTSAVFEVDGELPRAVQGINSDWTYTWSFREVFEDEVPGGFEEKYPWVLQA
ncbi:hypothetical protein [Marinibacterium sp. SX1]|uniref:hypothetical protein n=1 Tax=Marinibacterium sp. SX1 TaxID=3388424 RepID=UPI003D1728B8